MNIDETFEDQCFLLNIRIPLVVLTGVQFRPELALPREQRCSRSEHDLSNSLVDAQSSFQSNAGKPLNLTCLSKTIER